MALTLKSLRKEGIDVSANPESFAKEEALDSKDLKNKLPVLVRLDCTYCCHHVLESPLPPLSILFLLFF
jgi:hypothetical protein